MDHRISVGMLVEKDDRLLLVRHERQGRYNFWVAPGGGVQGTEELPSAACREVKEETGLDVLPGTLIYIEEFYNPETRHCKFWFSGQLVGGELSTSAPEATVEYIVEAAWLSREEIAAKQVFPSVLENEYWQDRTRGWTAPRYLGLRKMEFW